MLRSTRTGPTPAPTAAPATLRVASAPTEATDPAIPDRNAVVLAFRSVEGPVGSCVGDNAAPWVLTEVDFDGPAGDASRVSVTTDQGSDAAECIGGVVLDVRVPPFSGPCLVVRHYWGL